MLTRRELIAKAAQVAAVAVASPVIASNIPEPAKVLITNQVDPSKNGVYLSSDFNRAYAKQFIKVFDEQGKNVILTNHATARSRVRV